VLDLWQGEDIYLRYGFPTPPVMAMILTPFASLEGRWTMGSWFVAKAVLVLAVIGGMMSAARRGGAAIAPWALAGALAVSARPIMGDLLHGNVNIWILFLVVVGLLLFQRGLDELAGWVLALAVACKVTPALFVIYFAWKGAWRVVTATLVGLCAWLVFVPASVLGFERNLSLLRHWADYMIWPFVGEGRVETEAANQSAMALVHRWGLGNGWELVFAGGLILGVAWMCRSRWSARSDLGWWHEWGLVFLATLLLSERSWKHHFVWLVPIAVVLFASAWSVRATRGESRGIVGLLGLSALLMLGTSQDVVRPIAGEAGAKLMQSWGAYVWASLALILAHGIALRVSRRVDSPMTEEVAPETTSIQPRPSRVAAAVALVLVAGSAVAQEADQESLVSEPPTFEARSTGSDVKAHPANGEADEHPLDPAIEWMEACRDRYASVFDYEARLISQERLGRHLQPVQDRQIKVRQFPLSVYAKSNGPQRGAESLYVDGENDGQILTHSGKTSNPFQVTRRRPAKDAPGPLRSRHSIREIGVGHLIDKLRVRWEYERQFDGTEVTLSAMKLNGRPCVSITAVHPHADDGRFLFHTVRVYVDKGYVLPVRFEAYGYPETIGREPGDLLECSTYLELTLNPGLKAEDFSPRNPEYHFSQF
jgi:hypothetical protein